VTWLDYVFWGGVSIVSGIFIVAVLVGIYELLTESSPTVQYTSPYRPTRTQWPVPSPPPGTLYVQYYFVRKTGKRTYRDRVLYKNFSSAFELFDAVLLECMKKRKRVRVKGWMLELGYHIKRQIDLEASNEEIDEFCGQYWQDRLELDSGSK
jgi:hypothetical protein